MTKSCEAFRLVNKNLDFNSSSKETIKAKNLVGNANFALAVISNSNLLNSRLVLFLPPD